MHLRFVKMHGIGNDFIMVDAIDPADRGLLDLSRRHAVSLCDRKFGVGADGVIVILPAPGSDADFRMVIYNSDGSESEMCGNGIRCFAKYVYDRGYKPSVTQRVLTGRGVLTTTVALESRQVASVQVDMGEPILSRSEIPVSLPGNPTEPVIDHDLEVDGINYRVTCVSMGNPHCIVFVDGDVDRIPLVDIGPKFEHHSAFPNRINTEFVQVLGPSEIRMRVWERGAAETLACGTGACASAVASALNERTDCEVDVHLAGGDLRIDWRDDGHVMMTGPAVSVFEGTI